MTQQLIEITKALQTPLRLNGKAGERVLIMTDTQMDPLLWQGLLQCWPPMGRRGQTTTRSTDWA